MGETKTGGHVGSRCGNPGEKCEARPGAQAGRAPSGTWSHRLQGGSVPAGLPLLTCEMGRKWEHSCREQLGAHVSMSVTHGRRVHCRHGGHYCSRTWAWQVSNLGHMCLGPWTRSRRQEARRSRESCGPQAQHHVGGGLGRIAGGRGRSQTCFHTLLSTKPINGF